MPFWLNPVQWWVWRDPARRGWRLLRFAEVEADGGHDIARAAETTSDARLRGLYLRHAQDEQRHAELFRSRGAALLRGCGAGASPAWQPEWLAPGERGLDDVEVSPNGDARLLAFLHLSEAAAARHFDSYRAAVGADAETSEVFTRILRDEEFHMRYTGHELARIAPRERGRLLWRARLGRLWRLYLRLALGLAAIISFFLLTLQYFLLVPLFALAAKRAARREPEGWAPARPQRDARDQY